MLQSLFIRPLPPSSRSISHYNRAMAQSRRKQLVQYREIQKKQQQQAIARMNESIHAAEICSRQKMLYFKHLLKQAYDQQIQKAAQKKQTLRINDQHLSRLVQQNQSFQQNKPRNYNKIEALNKNPNFNQYNTKDNNTNNTIQQSKNGQKQYQSLMFNKQWSGEQFRRYAKRELTQESLYEKKQTIERNKYVQPIYQERKRFKTQQIQRRY